MSSNSTTTATTTPDDGLSNPTISPIGSLGYGIGISIVIFILFMIITYASYRCKQGQIRGANSGQVNLRLGLRTATPALEAPQTHHHGLDEVTLLSYPRFTYAQLKPHKGGGAGATTATGCSICLSDYKDTDLLRLLPECGHFFHLHCVDPWLSVHATCPICRNSQLSPAAPPPVSHAYVDQEQHHQQ